MGGGGEGSGVRGKVREGRISQYCWYFSICCHSQGMFVVRACLCVSVDGIQLFH